MLRFRTIRSLGLGLSIMAMLGACSLPGDEPVVEEEVFFLEEEELLEWEDDILLIKGTGTTLTIIKNPGISITNADSLLQEPENATAVPQFDLAEIASPPPMPQDKYFFSVLHADTGESVFEREGELSRSNKKLLGLRSKCERYRSKLEDPNTTNLAKAQSDLDKCEDKLQQAIENNNNRDLDQLLKQAASLENQLDKKARRCEALQAQAEVPGLNATQREIRQGKLLKCQNTLAEYQAAFDEVQAEVQDFVSAPWHYTAEYPIPAELACGNYRVTVSRIPDGGTERELLNEYFIFKVGTLEGKPQVTHDLEDSYSRGSHMESSLVVNHLGETLDKSLHGAGTKFKMEILHVNESTGALKRVHHEMHNLSATHKFRTHLRQAFPLGNYVARFHLYRRVPKDQRTMCDGNVVEGQSLLVGTYDHPFEITQ